MAGEGVHDEEIDEYVRARLLKRTSDTGISLWWAAWELDAELEGRHPRETPAEEREHVLRLIEPLIASGRLWCADVALDGTVLPWEKPPNGFVDRIGREWSPFRRPEIGRVCALLGPDWPQSALSPGPGALNAVDSAAMQDEWLDHVRECGDVSLLSLADPVRAGLGPSHSPAEIRRETLRLLGPLLASRVLVPAEFDKPGPAWTPGAHVNPWPAGPEDWLRRIAAEWPEDFEPSDIALTFFVGADSLDANPASG